jgi:hypothetical protein
MAEVNPHGAVQLLVTTASSCKQAVAKHGSIVVQEELERLPEDRLHALLDHLWKQNREDEPEEEQLKRVVAMVDGSPLLLGLIASALNDGYVAIEVHLVVVVADPHQTNLQHKQAQRKCVHQL